MRVLVCALFFVAVFLPQIVRAFELVVFGNDFDALKRLQKHQHHGLSNRDEAMGTSLGSESAEEEEDEGGGGEVRDDDVWYRTNKTRSFPSSPSKKKEERRRRTKTRTATMEVTMRKGIVVVMEEVMRKTKRRVKARSARARNY
jgi:hypothetical protein